MLKWKIGDVTVTRVVELELPVPYSAENGFLEGSDAGDAAQHAVALSALRAGRRLTQSVDPRAAGRGARA